MTTILGYARVSPLGQDLDAQLVALNQLGVEASRGVHRQALGISQA